MQDPTHAEGERVGLQLMCSGFGEGHLAEDDVADDEEMADGDEELPPSMKIPRPSRQARRRRTTRPSGQPSISLEAIRGKMNLANVKDRTRATKTLDTHRREIEKLVLWFYNNHHHLIGETFGACYAEIV